MIPADLAGLLRVALPPTQPEAPGPVIPAQRLADVLTNLAPGQRIFAEIQGILANGTYRAVVAQRDVTLALPFPAKAGDSLELEVLESDGKVTLAFVANRTTGQQAPAQGGESVRTALSQTGRLIGDLLGRSSVEEGGARAAPAPLNGNLPLLKSFADAAQLAPILKEALSRSGVFYEAHQARWVAGQLPTDALRQEPQGKLPPTVPPPPPASDNAAAPPRAEPAPAAVALHRVEQAPTPAMQPGNPIPRELTPIVQQQLDALATQNYAWQGQIWPNQKMWWEISEGDDRSPRQDDEAGGRWNTRLKLSLPSLGGVEAVLRLQAGSRVDIALTADTPASESRLREHLGLLRESFAAAGLDLTQLSVQHGEIPA